jgi:hypothetical protein
MHLQKYPPARPPACETSWNSAARQRHHGRNSRYRSQTTAENKWNKKVQLRLQGESQGHEVKYYRDVTKKYRDSHRNIFANWNKKAFHKGASCPKMTRSQGKYL